MPRVVKGGKAAGAPVAKAAAKKKNGYVKSQKIPLGEILTDLSRGQWRVGPSIGSGGFGDIYCACKADSGKKKSDDYDCVIKIEPHGNGPLFVEMHFYLRNAKFEDIRAFCDRHKLKSIGMPHLIASGSHMQNNEKHRFIVMPRYGKDVWSHFLANGKRLPQHTIYRLALQMLDVYEYVHGCTYVHADLKGANILLDYKGKNPGQAYLVDFGLANHYITSDYKLDPRKSHNGTIEYTSRDAHNGVSTMRGDLEILGYNLVHWSGVELPWETLKLLTNPVKVQKSKEDFMKDVNGSLNKLFNKNPPAPIKQFLNYVQSMEYNEAPDYEKCRKLFQAGLKSLNKTNTGPLEMTFDARSSPKKQPLKRQAVESDTSEAEEDAATPAKSRRDQQLNRAPSASPSKRKQAAMSPSPVNRRKVKTDTKTLPESPRKQANGTPQVKISPRNRAASVATSSSAKKSGNTIVNDNVTPNPKSNKTYEFNFELDVSVDANVIVNIKRKKKGQTTTTTTSEPKTKSKRDESKENLKRNRNVDESSEVPPSPCDSPVPRVSVRKLRTTQSPAAPAAAAGSPRVAYRRVK